MKRADGLAPLSRDHHAALVLAKRIATAQRESAAAGALASRALDTFARELEPHFRIEEASLLPLLQAAGQSALVARTLSEHEELRELERRIRAGDVESLWRFGSLLDAHVRFEERELFPVSESVLGTESLAAVALAAQRPPTRAEPSLPPGPPQHP